MSLPHYPEYKASGVAWLGEVPGHWKMRSLRYAATIQNGSDFKDCEVAEGGYPVLGSGGEFARISKFIYDQPSVLLGRKGTIDNPLYIEEPFWTVDTLFYTKIAADTHPKFFYWFCTSIPFGYFQFGSAVPSMTQNDLYGIKMPIPAPDEQQAIATFLDRETGKIDALVAEQEKLIALLKEKRQAVISHAVTKGLNPNARMKDSGIAWLGEVPVHWEVRSISSLCTKITNGYVGPTRDILVDDGVRYLQSLHIKNNRIKFDDPYFVTEEWSNEHQKSILETGDVLIVQTGDIGQVAVVTEEFAGCNCHALIIVALKRSVIHGVWLSLVLNSDYGFHSLLSIQTGALHPHLNCGNVKDLFMPVPPLEEQQTIAAHLDTETAKLDTLTAEANRAIALLQERRSALISAAVTGKIDVRRSGFIPTCRESRAEARPTGA